MKSTSFLFSLICTALAVFATISQSVGQTDKEKQDLTELSLKDLSKFYVESVEEATDVDVVTASREAQKITNAPATIISISAEEIRKYGWRDLKDVFRSLPGVDVSYDTQGEVRTLVRMRGIIGNQKLLILQDGQRQNPITGERFVFGHNQPLHYYDRIEVVYGPASALYGADAYAGVVNLITKDGKGINGVAANVGYVSTNAVTADLTYGKQFASKLDVVVSGRVYQGYDFASVISGRMFHEDYNDPNDYGPVNRYVGDVADRNTGYPINNWNLFGKLKYKRLSVGFDWAHTYETNALSTIPTNYAYTENNVWGQELRHTYISYDIISTPTLSLTTTVSLGDYALSTDSNFDIIQNAELSTSLPSYKYAYSGYIQPQTQLSWKPNEKVLFTAGALYDYVKSFPKTQNLAEPFDPDQGLSDDLRSFVDPQSGFLFGLEGLTDSIFRTRNYYSVGTFAQMQMNPIPSLTLTAGGRYDYFSIYGGTFNPRVGLIHRPAKKLTLKAIYGSAYIQPSNYYRWENFANPFIAHVPNEDIKPERLQSYEFSAQYFPSYNVSARIALYRNNMQDIIRPVFIDASTQGGRPFYNPLNQFNPFGDGTPYVNAVEINSNQGSMYSQGLESELTWRFGDFNTSLAYTYVEGRDNGAKLAKISNHKINLNSVYSRKKLYISASLRYYSAVSTARGNSRYGDAGDQSYSFPGAAVIYANAGYHLKHNLRFNISVDNLLNTKHYNAAPYGESGWIQPRTPQSLMKIHTGFSYKF